MPPALQPVSSEPLREMNTTPLIDVMLVLLIMFVITIPIQTHAVKLDLPRGEAPPRPDPVKNRVEITEGGAILWNGAEVSKSGLRYNLILTTQMRPAPELQLQPEANARYGLVDEVLALTKEAHVEHLGFVGNERHANF